MQYIRQHIIFKHIWFMMTILFINTSVDPVDPDGDWVPEDLSVNEMETITEIVAEEILNIDDCFQETDDHDTDKDSTPVKVVKDCSQYAFDKITLPKLIQDNNGNSFKPEYFNRFHSQFIGEITAPPPKLAA